MTLSNPPIGLAAVEAFYNPVAPQLTEFTVTCGTRTFHVTSHRKAMPNIAAFFATVTARNLAHLITSWDGCYNDRPKRLSSQLSMHGRGAAFDINASANAQGDAEGTMPPELVEIARGLGFFWGGDFHGKYVDKMHFQLGTDFALNGRAVPRVTISEPPPPPSALTAAPALEAAPVPEPFRDVKVFSPTGALTGTDAKAGLLFTDDHAYVRATALAALLALPVTATLEQGVIILRVTAMNTAEPKEGA